MNHRFTTLKKPPLMDVTGKWEVRFADPDGDFAAIGEFVQDGNRLTGTFLTETGDYRYLEGSVQANKLYLSTFDGAHAFLFEAKIMEDSTMVGSFRSGKHYQVTWQARKNEAFELGDPLELTYLKEGYDKFDFAFPNAEGKMVSLNDDAYKNKVKIIEIIGTWCPNCRDATRFLTQYLEDNPNPDLAVIALSYEKYREEEKAINAIRKYKKHFGFDYEILLAGYYNKKEAAQSLPMLNHILSYPTLIFIDRDEKVRRIHTGFSGPATSEYEAFKTEFESFVTQLLKEPNQ
jgi:thiol-disulfide isomerase/thioredoxin